ncbi:MAG: transcriptional repressor LexA [Gammaproteobacteria bacterium]|nr:transcriptional repressor LexA [Gammaproteobacteria bacterium]
MSQVLTESQLHTYEYIKQFIRKEGIAPTTAEITSGLGLKSRSAIHRNLQAISEAGLIKLIPNRKRNIRLLADGEAENELLPLVGRIAAGRPIEALEYPEPVDVNNIIAGVERYILEVKGDSMIGDNICDGDYVICEHAATVRNGQIAVCLVNNEEATLKRVIVDKENGTVTLIPSNSSMQPMEYPADQVQVRGVYLGLLRLGKMRTSAI